MDLSLLQCDVPLFSNGDVIGPTTVLPDVTVVVTEEGAEHVFVVIGPPTTADRRWAAPIG